MDRKPLIQVKAQPYLGNRQTRWAQKLGRYNYIVEYKKSTINVTADSLSRCPDLQGKKAKFVHFSDQRGFPLVFAHVFGENDMICTSFEWLVQPAGAFISNGTNGTIFTFSNIPVPQIGIKNADRQFLQWYLSRVAPYLPFQQCIESVEFASLHDRELVQVKCPAYTTLALDQSQDIINSIHRCLKYNSSFQKSLHSHVANLFAIFTPVFHGVSFSIGPYITCDISQQCRDTTNTKFSCGD